MLKYKLSIMRKDFEFAIDKCILQDFNLKVSCAYSGKFLYIYINLPCLSKKVNDLKQYLKDVFALKNSSQDYYETINTEGSLGQRILAYKLSEKKKEQIEVLLKMKGYV